MRVWVRGQSKQAGNLAAGLLLANDCPGGVGGYDGWGIKGIRGRKGWWTSESHPVSRLCGAVLPGKSQIGTMESVPAG